MIAGVAALREEAGAGIDLPFDIDPNLPLASV
jgi:hypothetical protein